MRRYDNELLLAFLCGPLLLPLALPITFNALSAELERIVFNADCQRLFAQIALVPSRAFLYRNVAGVSAVNPPG